VIKKVQTSMYITKNILTTIHPTLFDIKYLQIHVGYEQSNQICKISTIISRGLFGKLCTDKIL